MSRGVEDIPLKDRYTDSRHAIIFNQVSLFIFLFALYILVPLDDSSYTMCPIMYISLYIVQNTGCFRI